MDVSRVIIPDSALQKMFTKHGSDFGLAGSWNLGRADDMRAAIIKHLNGSNVQVIAGKYRGKPVTHVVDPNSGLNVIIDSGYEFVGGWRLSPEQLNSVLVSGRLF
jgi:hypothetical protein